MGKEGEKRKEGGANLVGGVVGVVGHRRRRRSRRARDELKKQNATRREGSRGPHAHSPGCGPGICRGYARPRPGAALCYVVEASHGLRREKFSACRDFFPLSVRASLSPREHAGGSHTTEHHHRLTERVLLLDRLDHGCTGGEGGERRTKQEDSLSFFETRRRRER